ncbi:MAG TPA: histidine kinase dimerization/phospho-acceptor domain-containing protein, partial [Chloroflexota bacterium]|nr:histidine kinase dimerization/phospho-acceptor domain-containing protein [Chloroflexota bacterium]
MSIRLRLALWYTAVLGITLVVFSVLLYMLMEYHLINESDDSIISRAQHIASTLRVETGASSPSSPSLGQVALPPIDAFESPGIYVQVMQLDGFVVARSDNLGDQQLPIGAQDLVAVRRGNSALYTVDVSGQQVRVYAQPLGAEGKLVGIVLVARTYSDAFETLYQLRSWLLLAGGISLLLAGAIGWAIAGSALRPIATMTRTARAIALSKGFSRRLEDTNSRDELGQLGLTFNEMLASLEDAYNTQQRFIADASHELRTPLTAVRANLELLEKQGEALPPADRHELAAAAASEANRMSRLVEELLSLA